MLGIVCHSVFLMHYCLLTYERHAWINSSVAVECGYSWKVYLSGIGSRSEMLCDVLSWRVYQYNYRKYISSLTLLTTSPVPQGGE